MLSLKEDLNFFSKVILYKSCTSVPSCSYPTTAIHKIIETFCSFTLVFIISKLFLQTLQILGKETWGLSKDQAYGGRPYSLQNLKRTTVLIYWIKYSHNPSDFATTQCPRKLWISISGEVKDSVGSLNTTSTIVLKGVLYRYTAGFFSCFSQTTLVS